MRDRATALTEDIWCEKIRGLQLQVRQHGSHRPRLRCVLLNVNYAPIATKFRSAAK
jgi:hypothetical protein